MTNPQNIQQASQALQRLKSNVEMMATVQMNKDLPDSKVAETMLNYRIKSNLRKLHDLGYHAKPYGSSEQMQGVTVTSETPFLQVAIYNDDTDDIDGAFLLGGLTEEVEAKLIAILNNFIDEIAS